MNYDIEEVVFMYFDKFLDLLKLAFRQKAAVYDAVEFFKNFFSNIIELFYDVNKYLIHILFWHIYPIKFVYKLLFGWNDNLFSFIDDIEEATF